MIRHNKSDEWFHELVAQLTKEMNKRNTDPALITTLSKGMKSWRDHIPFNITNLEPQHRELVKEHDNIGRRQIFNGRWSKKWAKLQERHERETDLTGGNKY